MEPPKAEKRKKNIPERGNHLCKISVLDSLGSIPEYQSGGSNKCNLSFTILEAEKFRSKDLGSAGVRNRVIFMVFWWPSSTWWRESSDSLILFMRPLILLTISPLTRLYYLLKPPSLHAISLGVIIISLDNI